jgi:predicted  nucleic acid-binding Zn-ribbon protein
MRKLPAVENARAIMTEGMEWGVWKWMTEKKRLRETADEARAALDDLEKKVKAAWSDDLKHAYNQLLSDERNGKRTRKNGAAGKKAKSQEIDDHVRDAVRRVMQADDEAYDAHETAEDVFAEAEERMSTNLAREGARKALVAYDLHEAAIRHAEALSRSK